MVVHLYLQSWFKLCALWHAINQIVRVAGAISPHYGLPMFLPSYLRTLERYLCTKMSFEMVVWFLHMSTSIPPCIVHGYCDMEWLGLQHLLLLLNHICKLQHSLFECKSKLKTFDWEKWARKGNELRVADLVLNTRFWLTLEDFLKASQITTHFGSSEDGWWWHENDYAICCRCIRSS